MALTYTIRETLNLGSVNGKIVRIVGDASYPAGGYDLNADRPKLGFAIIYALLSMGDLGLFKVAWDRANKKLRVYYPQGGEALGAADGGATVDAGVVAVTSSAANGAIVSVNAGKAREVAAATNLSTLDLECLILGA